MRVLVAEDERSSRRIIENALRRMGHEPVAVTNGAEALELLQSEPISMLITDWMMPELDGLALTRRIRQMVTDRYVYVILLTSNRETEDRVAGLTAGADDYVTKPFHFDEFRVRIRAGERIVKMQVELDRKNAQLRRLALVDPLTGILNRRAFDESLVRTYERAKRYEHPFAVIMFDVDAFKAFNDSGGHERGDEALIDIAQTISSIVRRSDEAFRYGGEEFVCILQDTDVHGAGIVAERVRASIEASAIPHPGNPPFGVVTVSAGAAGFAPRAGESDVVVVARADRMLYAAKNAGRNQVRLDSADSMTGTWQIIRQALGNSG